MSVASRVPAFLLLGLVVVAAALLVAGYGVPVGIGVITDLLLGVALILAFVGLRPRASGSPWFGTWGARSGPVRQPDAALMERHGRDAMRVAGVDEGALRWMVAVGSSTEARGVRVELIAVEIREDGGLATLVAHKRPPVGFVGHLVEVMVSDDAGTAYVASGQGSGGSSPSASRHEIRFSPAPPEGAHVLTFCIASFADPFPTRSVGLDGPWEFRVAL